MGKQATCDSDKC